MRATADNKCACVSPMRSRCESLARDYCRTFKREAGRSPRILWFSAIVTDCLAFAPPGRPLYKTQTRAGGRRKVNRRLVALALAQAGLLGAIALTAVTAQI